MIEDFNHKNIARDLFNDIQKVQLKNVPNLRKIRKIYSKRLVAATPQQVLDFVRYFANNYNYKWVAFEILYCHKSAITIISPKELKEFGVNINSWGESDIFAGFLAGPAWRNGQIPDELILKWARSSDYWWRRVAVVCTISLNKRSAGGHGDIDRTLKICRAVRADKNDMVNKALSWALRELIPHNRKIVIQFINENEKVLAARVKREVKNKLITGLKNPRRNIN
jgi:3-methyladenine DNA glycosylase AlkD